MSHMLCRAWQPWPATPELRTNLARFMLLGGERGGGGGDTSRGPGGCMLCNKSAVERQQYFTHLDLLDAHCLGQCVR